MFAVVFQISLSAVFLFLGCFLFFFLLLRVEKHSFLLLKFVAFPTLSPAEFGFCDLFRYLPTDPG